MSVELKNSIEEEILLELDGLKTIEIGSPEYEKAVAGIAKLSSVVLENEKESYRVAENAISTQLEKEQKEMELRNDKRDRIVRNTLTGAGLAITTGLSIWGTLKSLKFEETGSVTTLIGRGWLGKLLPKK